jgi:hypothetical protein
MRFMEPTIASIIGLPPRADGPLCVCTSSNTWSLYYTPYTYPHPLVNKSTAGGRPPKVAGLVNMYKIPANGMSAAEIW